MIDFYSNSSTTNFRRCTYRFHQQYMLSKEEGSKSGGLRMGSAGHIALKAYYNGGGMRMAVELALGEYAPENPDELNEFGKLEAVLYAYWKSTLTDRWKVIMVEQEVKIGKIMGIVDLVIEEPNGRKLIVDHKFQKSRSLSHLPTNTQVSFYLLLARELGLPIEGLIYNIIPTNGENPGVPIRRLCSRSNTFLDNFSRELHTQIELMERFQENPQPLRNFTADCVWDCPIQEFCTKEMEKQYDATETSIGLAR